ncbi:MAG: DUF2285 domain-containing protein [Pseudomonadota bacterium]
MKLYTLPENSVTKHYNFLWRMTRDRWAWEYQRREREYIDDATTISPDDVSEIEVCHSIKVYKSRVPQTLAERWGLIMMVDPSLNAIEANAVWTKEAFPDQVAINVVPRAPGEECEIYDKSVSLCKISHFTDAYGNEFLLTRGNGCLFQSRCTGLSLLSGQPVKMDLALPDFESYDRKVKAHKEGMRVFGDDPHAETPKWTKRTQMLRDGLIALDCLDLDMSHREIANVLYGPERVNAEWEHGRMRDAINYIISRAKALRDGGFRVELLGSHLGPGKVAA